MAGKLRDITDNWRRGLWIMLMLMSLAGLADIPSSTILNMSVAGKWFVVVSVAAFKATVLVVLVAMSERRKLLRRVLWVLIAVYCAVCVVNGAAYYFYNLGITNKLLTIVGQTNSREAAEFFASFAGVVCDVLSDGRTYLAIGLTALVCFGLDRMPKRWLAGLALSLSLTGGVALAIVFTSQGSGRAVFSPVLRLAKSVVQAHAEAVQIKEAMSKVRRLPDAESVESERLADVVMIVGESASRNNLSLYGFGLNTSPGLCALSDSLVVFDDVTGTSTITSFNMNRILTFLTDRDRAEEWSESPMLVSVLKQAGYATWWLSNQERSGMWGNGTVAMVSQADSVRFAGSISSDDATLQEYDGILLPEVEKALDNDTAVKFIGVHMMGSHNEYRRRYPVDFGVFNADSVLKLEGYGMLSRAHAQTLAEYCNSLVYSDYIVTEIMKMVSRQKHPAVVIYFSDHGENVYDGGGDFCGRDEKHVEVPFVVYVNDAFVHRNGDLYRRLKAAARKPMTTAGVSQMVLSITGTKYVAYCEEEDVLSPEFKPRQRYVDGKVWNGGR